MRQDLVMESRFPNTPGNRRAALFGVILSISFLLTACSSTSEDLSPTVTTERVAAAESDAVQAGSSLDPNDAYVTLEVRNNSSRNIGIHSYDQSNLGSEQIIEKFPPGATLTLWGAATSGADVWVMMQWCEDENESYVNDIGCAKSESSLVSMDFRQTWTGAPWVNYSYNYPSARGKLELSPQDSYTFGSFSEQQNPIEFYISRRNNTGDNGKVHRYRVVIENASGS